MEKLPYFHLVDLTDLLNHTHGLGSSDLTKSLPYAQSKSGELHSFEEIMFFNKLRKKSDGDGKDEEYGDPFYGNTGYDLAAMIIECIVSEKDPNMTFDKAVENLIFIPIGMNNSFTQSNLQAAYDTSEIDIARGYGYATGTEYERGVVGEWNWNTSCQTRAAGGMKSSASDLALFAKKFMSTSLSDSIFENQIVIDEIWLKRPTDREIHLGIFNFGHGQFGHTGSDYVYDSLLLYRPDLSKIYGTENNPSEESEHDDEIFILLTVGDSIAYKVAEAIIYKNEQNAATRDQFYFHYEENKKHPNRIRKDTPILYNRMNNIITERNKLITKLQSDYSVEELVQMHDDLMTGKSIEIESTPSTLISDASSQSTYNTAVGL